MVSNNFLNKLLDPVTNTNMLKHINSKIDKYGNTYLFHAIRHQNMDVINLLIKNNVKFNIKNNDGNTSLHILFDLINQMISKFDNNIIKYLEIIKKCKFKKIDLNIKNNDNITPLDILTNIDKKDADGNTLLHNLLFINNYELAILCINLFNPNINLQNNEGNTLLHLTMLNCISFFDDIEVYYFLHFLIKTGANENIKNKLGTYPVHIFSLIF